MNALSVFGRGMSAFTIVVALASSVLGQNAAKKPPKPPDSSYRYQGKPTQVRWEWNDKSQRWEFVLLTPLSPKSSARKLYSHRYLVILNSTDELLDVHVQYAVLDKRNNEQWFPENPATGDKAIVTELPSRMLTYLMHNNRYVSAVRARVWAVPRNGKMIPPETVWLVEEIDRFGARQYAAPSQEAFPYFFPREVPLPPNNDR